MKRTLSIAVLIVILLTFALPQVALAQYGPEDKIVLGGTFTLRSGETLDADLIVLGGSARLEENSTLTGDAVVFGGSLVSNGTIQGNLVSIGGNQSVNGTVVGDILVIGGSVLIQAQAVVQGDVTAVGGSVSQAPGAQIQGDVIRGFQIPPGLPGIVAIPGVANVPDIPGVQRSFQPLWSGLWFVFRLFIWAFLAALVALLIPIPTSRVARTIVTQPILSAGVGLLTAIVAPLVLLILAITICLIPVSLLGLVVLVIAWFFGRVALGMELGRRIGQLFDREWPSGLAAGIGTFVLAFVVDGTGQLIPCVGWVLPFIVGIVGLGAVILSRFGTQTYPPYQAAGVYNAPPIPPAPPSAELPEVDYPEPPPVEIAPSEE